MDWASGYTCTWRLFAVNQETWADAGQVAGVSLATVERSRWESANGLIESASIIADGDLTAGYYRLTMTAEQAGERQRVDVGTFLCRSTRGNRERGEVTRTMSGRSVLYPASRTKVLGGTFAPAGADGAEWAANMLRGAIAAPVEAAGGFSLDTNYVVKAGTTVLAAVWAILSAGGMTLDIDGRGRVAIIPLPDEPSLVLDSKTARLLDVSAGEGYDLSGIPNRYTAYDGRSSVTVTNDDPQSETSVQSVGYYDDVYDKAPVRTNGESLEGYCSRRLHELSVAKRESEYKRSVVPDIRPSMIVRAKVRGLGLEGDMRISRQSLDCTATGIVVTERAIEEVQTWT